MAEEFVMHFVHDVVDAAANLTLNVPRRRILWQDGAMELGEAAFQKNFRLSKDLTEQLVRILEPVLNHKTQYDLLTKVLCALHFLGHGSYQTPVGQHLCIGMSQSSVSRCIDEVIDALNHPDVFHYWVHFPKSFHELNEIVSQFYNLYRLPGVIGCIDCTHVAIVPPSSSFDERSYVNRKMYHSINTQLICDANLKILNVNALFPGGSHDSYIWSNSNVLQLLETLHNSRHTNYHLIADSGYPLRPWCLTPIMDANPNTPEERYNISFKKARCCVERCNGVLKGRFRCLLKDRTLHYAPNKASKIINACTVLHNMCINHNLELPNFSDLDNEQLGVIHDRPAIQHQETRRTNLLLLQARSKRTTIVNNYFQ